MIICIDGPAGTGKSTISRLLAQALGIVYFDSGAMYRAATLLCLEKGCSPRDAVECALHNFSFDFCDGVAFANGRDVSQAIRSDKVTQAVSDYAQEPSIRAKLFDIQRAFAKEKSAVFEGRDMGTQVFPDAECKIFLDARKEVRAQRRFSELQKKGHTATVDDVTKAIAERDAKDSSRVHAPLKRAHDAVYVDTSDLSLDDVLTKLIAIVKRV